MKVVEVESVSKKFKSDGKRFFAVKDVSFSVESGEIFGMLGPNGAGKTTLLNMIVGVLSPDTGSIKIFGQDIRKNRALMEQIGVSSGDTRFHWALRVSDILNFYGRLYGLKGTERRKRIDRLVKFFGLGRVLTRKFGYLSTGEKMRLTFAKSLLNYPKLLLLDEPTLGLDPDIAMKVRDEIKRINRKFGTTIILTSHYMNEVEQLADRIAFISRGRIADIGTIKKLKRKHFTSYDLTIRVRNVTARSALKKMGFSISGNLLRKKMDTGEDISKIITRLGSMGIKITDVESRRPTLEDYFVKVAGDQDETETFLAGKK